MTDLEIILWHFKWILYLFIAFQVLKAVVLVIGLLVFKFSKAEDENDDID